MDYQLANLVAGTATDEYNYKYTFYAKAGDPEEKPVYWKRRDYPDVIFRTSEAKYRALVREIITFHIQGRPLLVGTTSVEGSEKLSNRLRSEPVKRLLQVLMVRYAWLLANNREEDGRQISELEQFNKPLEKIQPNDLRPICKELDLSLNPEEGSNLQLLQEFPC